MKKLAPFQSIPYFFLPRGRGRTVGCLILTVLFLLVLDPFFRTGECAPKQAKKSNITTKKKSPKKKAASSQTVKARSSSEDELEKQKNELDDLRKQLSEKKKKREELVGKEKVAEKNLDIVEGELSLTEKLVEKLSRREEALEADLERTHEDFVLAQKDMEHQRTVLAWRVREIYKYGERRELEMFLSSRTFGELTKKYHYMISVADQDRMFLSRLKAKKEEIERVEKKLNSQHKEILALQEEKVREKKNLEALQVEKKKVLLSIREKRKEYENQIARLERAQKKLQDLIAQLEKKRKEEVAKKLPPKKEWIASSVFAQNKGKLPWPVQGQVISGYGRSRHERFGTVTFNNGIDIRAARGAPIKSVGKGRVEYVDWLSGYGKCAIVNHGGGYYTFYAHASEIVARVGEEVQPGQTIGYVGNTDSLSGDCLHFEIRQGKDAVNPASWLQ